MDCGKPCGRRIHDNGLCSLRHDCETCAHSLSCHEDVYAEKSTTEARVSKCARLCQFTPSYEMWWKATHRLILSSGEVVDAMKVSDKPNPCYTTRDHRWITPGVSTMVMLLEDEED